MAQKTTVDARYFTMDGHFTDGTERPVLWGHQNELTGFGDVILGFEEIDGGRPIVRSRGGSTA